MDPELSLRFTLTRRGLGRALAAALVCLLAPSIGSQSDPAHSLTFTTYFPAPVGAFAELAVTGSLNPIRLARDGGRVGIGDLGSGVTMPNAELVVSGGQAIFGQADSHPATTAPIDPPQGAEVLNVINGPGVVQSGLSMNNRSGGARWVIYPADTAGRKMLWFWNTAYPARPGVFGIDAANGAGALRVCQWEEGGCSGQRISMWRGTGTPGDTKWVCDSPAVPDGAFCPPPSVAGSTHLCCDIRWP